MLVYWIGGMALGLLVLFLAVDFFLLRGEEVAFFPDVRFDVTEAGPRREPSGGPELIIEIEKVGAPHSIVLSTYPQMLALRWSLTSKEGWLVVQGRDILRTDGYRLTKFVPQTDGPHVLRIERVASQPHHASVGIASPSAIDRVNVTVRVNERSIVKRILQRRNAARWLPGLDR